jgi:transglutaminase-like putative cysteine protease
MTRWVLPLPNNTCNSHLHFPGGGTQPMRLKLRHETRYLYDTPARGAIQILRLTPRNYGGQFVKRWRVEIDADCRLERDEDAYGNITHTFSVETPVDNLTILVEGEIDVFNEAGFVRGGVERFPPGYWLSTTPLTVASPDIQAFASDLAAAEGGDCLAFLHRLNATICSDFNFDLDATHPATQACEAFAQKSGVCQDFAQVFIAAARARGIPARYVSGYYLRSDTEAQEAGHAWAEAWLPGLGWTGFDPAHGLCPDERYIRLAVGRDYLEAAPIRGSRQGGEGEKLEVAVRISEGREIAEQ